MIAGASRRGAVSTEVEAKSAPPPDDWMHKSGGRRSCSAVTDSRADVHAFHGVRMTAGCMLGGATDNGMATYRQSVGSVRALVTAAGRAREDLLIK